jgi:hypothetical protein
VPQYVVTHKSLAGLPYKSLYEEIVPGSAHFPLMLFFVDHPNYNYYWIIEGDVRFSGNWRTFFDAFSTFDDDFLASHVGNYYTDPSWYWWSHLWHPGRRIPLGCRIRSFNPIYRISRRALQYLHKSQCQGWCGHFEVLIPTLLDRGGFKLGDFGGTGPFVAAGGENRFYTEHTLRHRPIFPVIGERKNTLYHPVKTVHEDLPLADSGNSQRL